MSDFQVVARTDDIVGEGPLWVPEERALYWIDLMKGTMHRIDVGSGAVETWTPPHKTNALAMRAGKPGMVINCRAGFAFFEPRAGRFELIADPEPERDKTFLNDGKCDRAGRWWGGTLDWDLRECRGSLYRLDADLSVHRMDAGIWTSNGLAWSLDDRTLYFNDTHAHCVYAYDYDHDDGAVGNRRVLLDTAEMAGDPDGMTIDDAGCLWIAFYGGAALHRVTPRGRVDRTVRLPVTRPMSCAFGGERLDVLYVTTGRFRMNEAQRAAEPLAGCLLALDVGARGVAEPRFAG